MNGYHHKILRIDLGRRTSEVKDLQADLLATALGGKGLAVRLLRDELGAYEFETGYPVDFGWLRRELGPEVLIHGGPSAIMLRQASPAEIRTETKRILDSGICDGGRFVLREGNNLAPGTPLANLAAMYETARAWNPMA